MKILFNGLGPKDTIMYDDKIFRNGSVVDMPADFATAYVDSHLAIEVKTENEVKEAAVLQNLEIKNAAKRKEIKEKAEAKEGDF